jgi:hypothetical protein
MALMSMALIWVLPMNPIPMTAGFTGSLFHRCVKIETNGSSSAALRRLDKYWRWLIGMEIIAHRAGREVGEALFRHADDGERQSVGMNRFSHGRRIAPEYALPKSAKQIRSAHSNLPLLFETSCVVFLDGDPPHSHPRGTSQFTRLRLPPDYGEFNAHAPAFPYRFARACATISFTFPNSSGAW